MINRLLIYWQLSLADFRERTRRSSFFMIMLGILFFGYLVITGKYTIQFGEYRPVYDSAWAGSLMAVCSGIILSIFGFYLVKGSVKRDRRTKVGQIIAATPTSRPAYIISKFTANILVLWFMIAILAVVAFLTLLFRNEAESINLFAFILPFLIISLPAMIFVAAAAVLFDIVHWLSGSIGNVMYLFMAEFCLVMGMLEIPLLDLGAISLYTDSVKAAAAAAFPGERIPLVAGFVMFDEQMQIAAFKTFSWPGIEWSPALLLLRLLWIIGALAIVGVAVPFFDRFDPARSKKESFRKLPKPGKIIAIDDVSKNRERPAYSDINRPAVNYNPVWMAAAELRLALKGHHWFWYLVMLGLIAAQLAAPFSIARQYLTPLAMVWPLIIWSSMGTRETQYETGQLLFSSPGPIRRQLPAVWLSGLIIAILSISGMLFRSAATGYWSYAAALIVAALLIPSAAFALGSLTGSKRLFEVIYLMIWYVGSIEHFAAIDLLGTTDQSITAGKMVFFGLLTPALIIAAIAGRRIQMARVE